jgi:hypothetical protein
LQIWECVGGIVLLLISFVGCACVCLSLYARCGLPNTINSDDMVSSNL